MGEQCRELVMEEEMRPFLTMVLIYGMISRQSREIKGKCTHALHLMYENKREMKNREE